MKSIRPPGRKDKEPSPPADDGDFDEGEFADTVFGDSDDTTTGGWWWSDGDLAGDRALRPAGPSTPSPAEGPRPKLAETAKPGPSAAADAQPLAPSRGPGITTARPARAIEAQRTAAGAEALRGADTIPMIDRTLPPPSLPSLSKALPGAPADEPIPMLTEVVQVPRYDTEDLPASLADVDWGDLAERVRENVLERLLRRSDTLLDANLHDTLQPALERAMEALTQELHGAMNRMIRDIVGRAVTEELTRLHAEVARHNRNQNRQSPK